MTPEQEIALDDMVSAGVIAADHEVLDEALDELAQQLAADCFGAVDRFGRCADCGRLLDWPRPRAHGKRGCAWRIATVVAHADWLTGYLMSIPVVGKALWLLRRREGGR